MAPRYISLHDLFPKLQTLISNHLFEILTCTLDWYIEPNRFKIKFPHQACSPVSTSINGTASHPVAQARSLGVMSDSFFLSSSIHIPNLLIDCLQIYPGSSTSPPLTAPISLSHHHPHLATARVSYLVSLLPLCPLMHYSHSSQFNI